MYLLRTGSSLLEDPCVPVEDRFSTSKMVQTPSVVMKLSCNLRNPSGLISYNELYMEKSMILIILKQE